MHPFPEEGIIIPGHILSLRPMQWVAAGAQIPWHCPGTCLGFSPTSSNLAPVLILEGMMPPGGQISHVGAHLGWQDIEVCRKESGEPYVVLHDGGARLLEERGARIVHLTLSHTENYAAAMAILER